MKSEVVEWRDVDGGQFVSVQNISTYGATDWEYFEIDSRNLLAVANHYSTADGNSYDIESEVFEWNGCRF